MKQFENVELFNGEWLALSSSKGEWLALSSSKGEWFTLSSSKGEWFLKCVNVPTKQYACFN